MENGEKRNIRIEILKGRGGYTHKIHWEFFSARHNSWLKVQTTGLWTYYTKWGATWAAKRKIRRMENPKTVVLEVR